MLRKLLIILIPFFTLVTTFAQAQSGLFAGNYNLTVRNQSPYTYTISSDNSVPYATVACNGGTCPTSIAPNQTIIFNVPPSGAGKIKLPGMANITFSMPAYCSPKIKGTFFINILTNTDPSLTTPVTPTGYLILNNNAGYPASNYPISVMKNTGCNQTPSALN